MNKFKSLVEKDGEWPERLNQEGPVSWKSRQVDVQSSVLCGDLGPNASRMHVKKPLAR